MFCDKCGSLMIPKKDKVVCSKCNSVKKILNRDDFKLTEGKKKENKSIVIDEGMILYPKVKAECTKCGNREAEWWLVQTRGIDEPETRFHRCTKCKHTWREY